MVWPGKTYGSRGRFAHKRFGKKRAVAPPAAFALGRLLDGPASEQSRPPSTVGRGDLSQLTRIRVVDEAANAVAMRQEYRAADPDDRLADIRIDVGE